MRLLALALVVAACSAAPSVPPAGGGSGGIVSVNPCADALLVSLVEPGRITAISHYSQDAAASSIAPTVARRFRATGGTAEEVIALRPSLVLASTFTPPATRDAYGRAGLRVLFLDSPTTVAASIAQVRQVAAAVGEAARGEVIARSIGTALAVGPSRRRPRSSRDVVGSVGQPSSTETVATEPRLSPGWAQEPSALLFLSGDLANGSGTLLDELLHRAGLRNAAADYGLSFTGRIPIESLVEHPPAVVIAPDGHGRTAALRRRLLPAVPQASFPRQLINCGGPAIVPALARLRAIRAGLR